MMSIPISDWINIFYWTRSHQQSQPTDQTRYINPHIAHMCGHQFGSILGNLTSQIWRTGYLGPWSLRETYPLKMPIIAKLGLPSKFYRKLGRNNYTLKINPLQSLWFNWPHPISIRWSDFHATQGWCSWAPSWPHGPPWVRRKGRRRPPEILG